MDMGMADRDYMRDRDNSARTNGQGRTGKPVVQPARSGFFHRVFVFVIIMVALTSALHWRGNAPFPNFISLIHSKNPPAALPQTGDLTLYPLGQRSLPVADFTITATPSATDVNHLVKLVDNLSGAPILSVFIRNGETATVKVPVGTYRVNIAEGSQWYGETKLFGRDMHVDQGLSTLDFSASANSVTGHTLTLKGAVNGNFPTHPLDRDSF
jgi:hypothetical protein